MPCVTLRRSLISLIIGLVALCRIDVITSCAATAVIDASRPQQIIRGFGGATVFRPTEPLTDADLDTLFGNGANQIGFTILRIRVAADESWRALELANAKGAIKRGAIVMATPWSPPASMKTNNSLIAGSLKTSSYAEYANYLNNFALYMAVNGASLYAISVQNEPDISVTYESCDWTPAQMLDFCRNYAGAINTTKVIAPESFQFRREMSDPILNDATAAANVAIIGGHIYGDGLFNYPLALSKGKELWMTEHLDLSTDWGGALLTGKEIHDCLAEANFSAYIWWYIKRYYGPLGEDGIITKRGHVMSQFSKFIRPDYVRIDATKNPTTGVYVSAYKRDKVVIVAVNLGTAAVSQAFSIGGLNVSSVNSWVTSETLSLAPQPALATTSGVFTASLPARSVSTFVGEVLVPAPTIVSSPKGHSVELGGTVVLEVGTTGEFMNYQWKRNGVALPGATSRILTLSNVQAADTGNYTVVVTNSGGQVTSAPAALTVTLSGNAGRLSSIATRSPVDIGDGVQIGGFVISGTAPKPVLIRAAGPALTTELGLSGTLADPSFDLYDQVTHLVLSSNDNWSASLAPLFKQLWALAWPAGSKDAALTATLSPGAYSAVVRGAGTSTGIGMVEIYDAGSANSSSRLAGLSSRTLVGINDNVQIAGLVISGATARTVVIRASGPALNKLTGLSGTLADPMIEVYDQTTHQVIASSDDWDASLVPHFTAVSLFPWLVGSKDAALVLTLDPGPYSVVVRGKNGGTGLALIEVYDEP